jgi:hypothetical protein
LRSGSTVRDHESLLIVGGSLTPATARRQREFAVGTTFGRGGERGAW